MGGAYTRHEPCRLKIKPIKEAEQNQELITRKERIQEWENPPGKRKFGIDNEYTYEDEEGKPKMKSNPYARKPQHETKYEKTIT